MDTEKLDMKQSMIKWQGNEAKLREFYVSSKKKRPCLGGKSSEEVVTLGLDLKM